jgi:hypothetical protein
MYEYVVYRSFAADPRDVSLHVMDILRQSSRHNQRAGLTGFLHSERGRFYQYIEGAKPAVEDLMSRLLIDRRHNGLEVRGRGMISMRLFSDWDMGFASAHESYLRATTADPNLSRPSGTEIVDFLLGVSKRRRQPLAATPQA